MSNTRFSVERHELFTATTGVHPVNSRNFLFGNKDLLLETNILIVNTVHEHIIILGIQWVFFYYKQNSKVEQRLILLSNHHFNTYVNIPIFLHWNMYVLHLYWIKQLFIQQKYDWGKWVVLYTEIKTIWLVENGC